MTSAIASPSMRTPEGNTATSLLTLVGSVRVRERSCFTRTARTRFGLGPSTHARSVVLCSDNASANALRLRPFFFQRSASSIVSLRIAAVNDRRPSAARPTSSIRCLSSSTCSCMPTSVAATRSHVTTGHGEVLRGNFWLMTKRQWSEASAGTRLYYRFARSFWVILFAYPLVFAFSITISPLIRDPKRHWDSAVSLALHGGAIAGLWLWQGAAGALLVVIIPMTVSTMIGAYFFYAQHSYVGMEILPDEEWSVAKAAVASCSYLKLGRLMKWISGDIGYHHVHHLNAAIPFYRLADAKRAIPEIKDPIITTLRPTDMVRCLRLKLWDEEKGEMVPFPRQGAVS